MSPLWICLPREEFAELLAGETDFAHKSASEAENPAFVAEKAADGRLKATTWSF
jgi:hypothetical protein